MATPAILPDGNASATQPAATPRPDRLWVHLLLLAATLFSTTVVGMRYMANFRAGLPPIHSEDDVLPYAWAFAHPRLAASGLPFSLTLLAILLTHEMGHYFAARAHNVHATLPFVIPAPSLSGTAGAIIRLRGRVATRAALLAIGAFGPVSGFLVAIAASILGLRLSHAANVVPEGMVQLHLPPLLMILSAWLQPASLVAPLLWHPVLVAAWVGVLITSLNLVPAGQFDGGHILYAFAPRAHRWCTWATIAVLIYLGVTCWLGWMLWAGLLLLPGMRHPRISDPTPLGWKLTCLGPACLAILLLCATPRPIANMSLLDLLSHSASR
jgi:hypothetical protein